MKSPESDTYPDLRTEQSEASGRLQTASRRGPLIEIAILAVLCLLQVSCTSRSYSQTRNDDRPPDTAALRSAPSAPASEMRSQVASGEEHWVRGNIARDRGEYEKAVTEYQLAIDSGYEDETIHIELGIVLDYYLHRADQAIPHYRLAIQHNPSSWRAHWSLASTLLETKQYAEALQELELTKQLDPYGQSNGFYTYYTGKAFDALGRRNEALREYEAFLQRAKSVEPESPRVREVRMSVAAIKGKPTID